MVAPLREREIDVWRVSTRVSASRLAVLRTLLSDDERERAARYPHERSRKFVIGRGALRIILGTYLEIAPAGLEITDRPRGKPDLLAPGAPWFRFNVSHSRELILIAISAGAEVGVDIEYIDPSVDWTALSTKVCTPAERSLLTSLPKDAACKLFFRFWSWKEAYVKARGDGFYLPLRHCEIELAPDQSARIGAVPGGQAEIDRWSLHALDIDADYAAALVAERGGQLRAYRKLSRDE